MENPSSDQLAFTPENYLRITERPLQLLTPEVRQPVLALWTKHRHLTGMDTPLSLAANIADWMFNDGLRADDVVAVLRRLGEPEQMSKHKFASDLMTALAERCAAAIRNRKAAADRRAEQAADDHNRKTALSGQEIQRMLREHAENMKP